MRRKNGDKPLIIALKTEPVVGPLIGPRTDLWIGSNGKLVLKAFWLQHTTAKIARGIA